MDQKSKPVKDFVPLDRAQLNADLELIHKLFEKILIDVRKMPEPLPDSAEKALDRISNNARLAQLSIKGVIDFIYDDDANWPRI